MDWKLKLTAMLLSDTRRRQDLQQRQRRLELEESREKPKGPSLTEYLEKRRLNVPQSPQGGPNGVTGTNRPRQRG
jgi:hypothetical protein